MATLTKADFATEHDFLVAHLRVKNPGLSVITDNSDIVLFVRKQDSSASGTFALKTKPNETLNLAYKCVPFGGLADKLNFESKYDYYDDAQIKADLVKALQKALDESVYLTNGIDLTSPTIKIEYSFSGKKTSVITEVTLGENDSLLYYGKLSFQVNLEAKVYSINDLATSTTLAGFTLPDLEIPKE